jgi:serine/threonine protein kinase
MHDKESPLTQTDVVVKLARTYGVDAHQHLYLKDLAPKLLAYSKQAGIPTAYVIELLPPPWITLQRLGANQPDLWVQHQEEIYKAVQQAIQCMLEGGFVHGDLRSNNIMIDAETLKNRSMAHIKLMDFDWSGKAGAVFYPASRNRSIKWPGLPAGPIRLEDDAELLGSWWSKEVVDARQRSTYL